MPTITDWLMVIITLAYVIATIAICHANYKAASASKAQLEEMKRQYADENRPHIEMEFCYVRRAWYILRFVNHGKTTAQHVRINLDPKFVDSILKDSFKNALKQVSGKECIIGVEQHYDLYIAGNELRDNPNIGPVTGTIAYEARGNKYEEEIFLDLEQYMTFFSSTSDEEDMLKTAKAIEKDLRALKDVLNVQHGKSEDTKNG